MKGNRYRLIRKKDIEDKKKMRKRQYTKRIEKRGEGVTNANPPKVMMS